MSATRHPHKIQSVHVESIDGELCVYDTERQRVHALNHTAAFVWQRCDGRTAPAELAAALSAEAAIDDAEAVVRLTLQELAAAQLLVAPLDELAPVSRRDLLRRGVAAAAIPAIYSIVAPTPAAAQSPPPPAAPTLTSVAPNQGTPGTTVAVTLTGTNFVVGATTVTVNSGGVTATNVIVGSTTSLTADIVITAAAVLGAHTVTVTTSHGTSGAQTFTVNPPPPPAAPTLTSVSPNQGIQGATVAVTLTGTNFVVAATTVNVSGSGVTVNNVVVGSTTSLTASFVLDAAAALGARTVTVTTAGGTSGGQAFTINAPAPVAPTLTSVSPNQGTLGTTVAVTLTGTNFVVAATTVNVSGSGVTVNNVVVGSTTSLTASFVLDPAAALGARTVTVTTAGGTSGGQTFTIIVSSGSQTFNFTGSPDTFKVPAGVVSITILATGAQGGLGFGALGGGGGLGGRTTATVAVTPGAVLTVLVGGVGPNGAPPPSATAGGFNGGGGSAGDGGGGGGASSVRNGATSLVIVGGGGGGGGAGGATVGGGNGGAGGGLIADFGQSVAGGGGGGLGGRDNTGGLGGLSQSPIIGTNGTAGGADQGGVGGDLQGTLGGGGGGGGLFGGGGGGSGSTGGGGGGGGGSSFATDAAAGACTRGESQQRFRDDFVVAPLDERRSPMPESQWLTYDDLATTPPWPPADS